MALPGYKRDRPFDDPKEVKFFWSGTYNLTWICIGCNIASFVIVMQLAYFIITGTPAPPGVQIPDTIQSILNYPPFWIRYIFGYVFSILISPIFSKRV